MVELNEITKGMADGAEAIAANFGTLGTPIKEIDAETKTVTLEEGWTLGVENLTVSDTTDFPPFALKTLWSGAGWYMDSSKIINLPIKLSDLNLGMWMHFQEFDGTNVLGSGHQYIFVPKTHSKYGGQGVYTPLFSGIGSRIGDNVSDVKLYLYISDTQIKGHDNNALNSVTGGTGTKRFVLTEVIGF